MIDYIRSEENLAGLLEITHQGPEPDRASNSEVEQISQVVHDILQSYTTQGGINNVNGSNVPSRQHITDITLTLQSILFPGYYDRRAIEEIALPHATGERVAWVYKHLAEETRKCLCFECRERDLCENQSECAERAQTTALGLLRAIPDIREVLLLDVRAAVDGDPAANSADEVILAYPSIAAITVYRLAHFLY